GEIGVTPMQQACYASVWANHGLWVQPHAARRIYNIKTGKWDTVAYKSRRVHVPDTVIETVRRAMLGVTTEPGGTAHIAQIPNTPAYDAWKQQHYTNGGKPGAPALKVNATPLPGTAPPTTPLPKKHADRIGNKEVWKRG